MKRVSIAIKSGVVKQDFNGFIGNTCSDEEDAIRILYAKLGVKTDVKHSDNKRDTEANGSAERERI